MSLTITKHSEAFSSTQQISPEDMVEIAALGFKTVINARPDNEGGSDQPSSSSIQLAAEKAGLHYVHIPVVPNNIQPTDIEACANFVAEAPTPILGFCKSGMRATSLHRSAQQAINPNASTNKQNWLISKLSYFLKNKCLITKLCRKLTAK